MLLSLLLFASGSNSSHQQASTYDEASDNVIQCDITGPYRGCGGNFYFDPTATCSESGAASYNGMNYCTQVHCCKQKPVCDYSAWEGQVGGVGDSCTKAVDGCFVDHPPCGEDMVCNLGDWDEDYKKHGTCEITCDCSGMWPLRKPSGGCSGGSTKTLEEWCETVPEGFSLCDSGYFVDVDTCTVKDEAWLLAKAEQEEYMKGRDCAGVLGGTAELDECGVCDGGNADKDDCGVCFGENADLDDCGVCHGKNGAKDQCGVCNGNNADVDECGVCGGSGAPCSVEWSKSNGNCSSVEGCCGPHCYGISFKSYVQEEYLSLDDCQRACADTEGCVSVTYSNFYANEFKESYKKDGCKMFNNPHYVFGGCNGGFVCSSNVPIEKPCDEDSVLEDTTFRGKAFKRKGLASLCDCKKDCEELGAYAMSFRESKSKCKCYADPDAPFKMLSKKGYKGIILKTE